MFSDAMKNAGWTVYALGGGLTAWCRQSGAVTELVTMDRDGEGVAMCSEYHGEDLAGTYTWAAWADFDNPNTEPTELDAIHGIPAPTVLSLPPFRL